MLPSAAELDVSHRRARAVARAWQAGKPYRFVRSAFADVPQDDVERVAAIAAALLADGSWIGPLLAPLLAALADDPWFEPPLRVTRDPLRTTVQLLDVPAGILSATVFDGPALAAQSHDVTLAASGRLVVARYHRAGGARLLRWQAGVMGADFSAATAAPLAECEPHALCDGDVVTIDGRTDAHLIEGAGGEVVALTFVTRAAGLVREYDRASGRLIRAASTDEAESRTRLLLTLLRVDGRADAAPCFEAATHAPMFHLRWSAMREWLALDTVAALPRLRALAAHDPHPEVCKVARATLAMVEARQCRA